jgi:hypothetical protein
MIETCSPFRGLLRPPSPPGSLHICCQCHSPPRTTFAGNVTPRSTTACPPSVKCSPAALACNSAFKLSTRASLRIRRTVHHAPGAFWCQLSLRAVRLPACKLYDLVPCIWYFLYVSICYFLYFTLLFTQKSLTYTKSFVVNSHPAYTDFVTSLQDLAAVTPMGPAKTDLEARIRHLQAKWTEICSHLQRPVLGSVDKTQLSAKEAYTLLL